MTIIDDKESIIRRLHNKSIIDPDTNCWLWKGAVDKSRYGKTEFKDEDGEWRFISTHRLSACLFMEMLPYSILHVLHRDELCNNRNCWNPDHLYLGTQADNYNDAVIRGTHNQTRKKCCPKCGGKYSFKFSGGGSKIERYCKVCTRKNYLRRKGRI